MNSNNTARIIVGLVALLIGVIVGHWIWGPGPAPWPQPTPTPTASPGPPADVGPAKYILMFGDPNGSTMVTANLSAFQSALANPAPNWSTLQEVPAVGSNPTPVPIPSLSPAPTGTLLIARIQVIQQGQNNAPPTMHVTQKVGLNDPTQVINVLAALNPQ